jgi:hypothetical protein
MKVIEKVSEDFLKFTYDRLDEIDSRKMCVEPWPPTISVSEDDSKQLVSYNESNEWILNDSRYIYVFIFF